MTSSLNLACNLSARVIPVIGYARLVYLLIEISGEEGAGTLPSNLSFIIDASDSMRIRLVTDDQFTNLVSKGQAKEIMTDGVPAYQITSIADELMEQFPRRIDYVAEALTIASEYLRSKDCFSVIAFAGQARCLVTSISGREHKRLHQVARELEFVRLGDGTHMDEGMAMAFDEVQRQSCQTHTSRLVLLTDGHTQNVKDCYRWAKKARKAGIKLTTMGIGAEFNEELLIPLADITGGNAYYVESPDQIPEAFREELGAALHISYRNVEVKLNFAEGAKLRRVHRVLPELSDFDIGANLDGSYALWIGDYDPSTPVALLAEVVVPPWPEGAYRLAQALLVWDDPTAELTRQNQRGEVMVKLSNSATAPLNEHVMNVIERVGAYKMGVKALESAHEAVISANQDDRSAATMRLRQAATRLLDMGEAALASDMLLQAEVLERNGNMDPEVTKKLRYETRRLSQRL